MALDEPDVATRTGVVWVFLEHFEHFPESLDACLGKLRSSFSARRWMNTAHRGTGASRTRAAQYSSPWAALTLPHPLVMFIDHPLCEGFDGNAAHEFAQNVVEAPYAPGSNVGLGLR